jgi:hypothetical protein
MAKIKPVTRSAATSKSRDLVPVGSKHLSSNNPRKRNENGDKPSTARALILRNGKHGARGSGELVLTSKMTGSEKLELLAGERLSSGFFRRRCSFVSRVEDMIEKYRKAVLGPFRLEQCLKIAESQFHGAFLCVITQMEGDVLLFQHTWTKLLICKIHLYFTT